jgi:hypothetical protein
MVLPSSPGDDPADWPLGRRNRLLFELHCLCFGPRLQGWTSCTGCGESVELELDAQDLMRRPAVEHDLEKALIVKGERFRLPTSRDLARVVPASDVKASATQLLERCRVNASEPSAWSEETLEEVGEKLAAADPMAETRLALHCPACGREWEETLDIASFVWAEIEARARRLLWEVHTLASAYGWTETDTLALSAARRAIYLEMVQA